MARKAKTKITRSDLIREWFGEGEYARDPEYMENCFGPAAQRLLDYLKSVGVATSCESRHDSGPRIAHIGGANAH